MRNDTHTHHEMIVNGECVHAVARTRCCLRGRLPYGRCPVVRCGGALVDGYYKRVKLIELKDVAA
jgi:hypothetical protein